MAGGYCNKARKDCVKHADWINSRLASIQLMEISYEQLDKTLAYEDKVCCLLLRLLPCVAVLFIVFVSLDDQNPHAGST